LASEFLLLLPRSTVELRACTVAAVGFSGGSQHTELRNAVLLAPSIGTWWVPRDSAEGQESPLRLRAFSAVVGPAFQPADP